MSNTNGQVSFVKSMNGILSFNTGSGTTIEGDTITTDIINCDTLNTINFNATNLNTDNIQGTTPSSNITLYTNSTGNVTIGSPNSLNYINGPLYVNTIFNSPANTNAFLFSTATGDVNLGSPTVPLIGAYTCTASNHLANKGYVDSMVGVNLLPLPNIWTGTSNTYNNKIVVNTIEANTVTACNLFNNATTNGIFIGTSITNGNIAIGNHSTAGSVGDVNIRTLNNLNLGNSAGTINMGTNMTGGQINIGNANTATLTLNTPITPNYTTAYTAFSGTPAGCIGNFISPTSSTATFSLTSTANRLVASFIDLPIGLYILYWNCIFYCPTTNAGITSIYMMMGSTSGGADIFSGIVECAAKTINVAQTKTYLVTQFYTNMAATGDVYFSTTATFSGTLQVLGSITSSTCKAVRIA